MRKLCYRHQRTIAIPAEVRGVGFLTGANVQIRFLPASPDTGIVFKRIDLHPEVEIPALVESVTGTHRRTTLGKAPAQIELVEHVLAALAGLRIDNCYIEFNAPEPPGLDGSSQRFVEALRYAGAVLQPARRTIWAVDRPIVISNNGATLSLYPPDDDELKISYVLDYGLHSPIGRQVHTQRITPEHFSHEIADCRTFLLETEAVELRRQGLGTRTTPADLLVFGHAGPIENRVRHANEPARHKVLDLVGDLSLFGHDLRGHLVAYRSGHPLNVEMVRTLNERLLQSGQTHQRHAA